MSDYKDTIKLKEDMLAGRCALKESYVKYVDGLQKLRKATDDMHLFIKSELEIIKCVKPVNLVTDSELSFETYLALGNPAVEMYDDNEYIAHYKAKHSIFNSLMREAKQGKSVTEEFKDLITYQWDMWHYA